MSYTTFDTTIIRIGFELSYIIEYLDFYMTQTQLTTTNCHPCLGMSLRFFLNSRQI